MTELAIDLNWVRQEEALKTGAYSNAHDVIFSPTYTIRSDSAPDWGGDPNHTNPEQALAAALSSCHMMTFLALAAKARWPVASFTDHAVAHLGKNPSGQMSVTHIALNPNVTFDAEFTISSEKLAEMQDRAHRYCFIANTLASTVKVTLG